MSLSSLYLSAKFTAKVQFTQDDGLEYLDATLVRPDLAERFVCSQQWLGLSGMRNAICGVTARCNVSLVVPRIFNNCSNVFKNPSRKEACTLSNFE